MIPRIWPGETVVCIGTGPSLTPADVEYCRDRARVIVVNDAYTLAPWADALYACDAKWWKWHRGAPGFEGLKYTLEQKVVPPPVLYPGVERLRNFGRAGLSLDPEGLKVGFDSGYQAINLAVLLGASRIILLGYDMRSDKKDHFFGAHPDRTKPNFGMCLQAYQALIEPLRSAGVSVVNATRKTALTCFPQMALEDALAAQDRIAS